MKANNPRNIKITAVKTLTVGSPKTSLKFARILFRRKEILEGDFDFEDFAFFAIADLGCFIQN